MIAVDFEKQFPGIHVRARFSVPDHSTTVLWGESGAGKTTILKCITGIARPDSGRIAIGGKAVFDSGERIDAPPRNRGVGMVFQHYALFPHLSALDNVALALRGSDRKQARAEALAWLDRFGIGRVADRRPVTLSGGERQRLALARTLAVSPRALLLDEPFSALDRRTKTDVYREFLALRGELAMSVILVSHDRAEAEMLGDRILEVEDGFAFEPGPR
jgi:molybdate transport system ATP-binding protein